MNYLILAIRQLLKNRFVSLINIFGLSLGMAASLVLINYVSYHKSFDSFHENADQIYRVRLDNYNQGRLEFRSATSYPAIAPTMAAAFNEIEYYSRLYRSSGIVSTTNTDQRITDRERGFYADPQVFDLLSVSFREPLDIQAFSGPNQVVISEGMAQRIFGTTEAQGQSFTVDNRLELHVVGVFRDYPANSHIQFDYLISYSTLVRNRGETAETSWGWYSFYTYFSVKPGTDIQELARKCSQLMFERNADYYTNYSVRDEIKLQPLKDIHLRSDLNEEAEINADGFVVDALMTIALIISILAWINYINITTSRSLERAKEIGIKKSVGATTRQLTWQLFTEAALVNVVSLTIAFTIIQVFNNQLFTISGIYFQVALMSWPWLALVAVMSLGILLSGFYPAFIISKHPPASVIRGAASNSNQSTWVRRGLSLFQFSISMIMIIASLVVYAQVSFLKEKDAGFGKDAMLVVKAPIQLDSDSTITSRLETFVSAVSGLSAVKSVTASSNIPGEEIRWTSGFRWEQGPDEKINKFHIVNADENYFDNYGLQMIEGQKFQPGLDSGYAIVNETALALFGFRNAKQSIGQIVVSGENRYQVIGVVRDYHQMSASQHFDPLIFISRRDYSFNYYSIKVDSDQKPIAALEGIYKEHFPDDIFNYFFLDDFFNRQFTDETTFAKMVGLFTTVALVIASLGLLGLSNYLIGKRIKEVGIRKIMGASVGQIIGVFSKDIIKIIGISALVTLPVAYTLLNSWLQAYAFRVGWELWWFLAPIVLIFLLVVATIGFQTVKASVTKPSVLLREL